MAQKLPYKDTARKIQQLMLHFPQIAGNEAVNFFLDSFKQQAWEGVAWAKRSTQGWNKRKQTQDEKKPRALLVKKGHLRRSLRIVETRYGFVKVASDRPYAQIHNEGGQINATQKVSAHKRKAHKVASYTRKNGTKVTAHKVAEQDVKAHARKVTINMPKRQFMGNSPKLNALIAKELRRSFGEILDNLTLFDK